MSTKGKDTQKESFVSALWMAAEYGRNINNIVPGVNRGVRFAGVATQKGEEVIEVGFQNEFRSG